KESIKQHANTDLYVGGLLDHMGGHVHPLNLVLGEAAAAERHGAVIHEDSPVTRVEPGQRPTVHTENGQVQADYVVICGNAYLDHAVPALQIGRASCRERMEVAAVAVGGKQKERKQSGTKRNAETM